MHTEEQRSRIAGRSYMKRFAADRNKAMRSMDEKKIRRFMAKHNQACPDDPRALWIMVHTVIKDCSDFDERMRANSIHWLESRGYVKQRRFKSARHLAIRFFGTRIGHTNECVMYELNGNLRAVPLWRKPKTTKVMVATRKSVEDSNG